jgi:uncharacterized membrane protein (TIGR02234 family)
LHASGAAAGGTQHVDVPGSDAAPLALALALVVLAGWGVILVSRTAARRIAAVIGLVATAGVLVVVVTQFSDTHGPAARALAALGATDVAAVSHQPWYWITGVAALAQMVVLAVAFRVAATWPTMSSRYDAPAERRDDAISDATLPDDDELADLQLWKALDEGRDPTTR